MLYAGAGENIKPEHIAATMLASAGLDYNLEGLRVDPITALLDTV